MKKLISVLLVCLMLLVMSEPVFATERLQLGPADVASAIANVSNAAEKIQPGAFKYFSGARLSVFLIKS